MTTEMTETEAQALYQKIGDINSKVRELVSEYNSLAKEHNHGIRLAILTSNVEESCMEERLDQEMDTMENLPDYDDPAYDEILNNLRLKLKSSIDYQQYVEDRSHPPYVNLYSPHAAYWFPSGINC